ncbi:MAG: VOC family protein [Pseudomonadota bacterium]|jgi:methylmalonyl-CoA/ethylmalonyl-CoA epimerase
MFTTLAHVSIAVPDLDEAIAQLQQRYGLAAGPVQENVQQGVRMAYVELANARIELMSPTSASSPIARFLERNPRGGIHHLSLGTPEVVATADRLAADGAQVLGDPRTQRNVHGEPIAFLHPRDFLGALVEIEPDGRHD